MNAEKSVVETYCKGFGHFYTLWALVALTKDLPTPKKLATTYATFMQKVQKLAEQDDLEAFPACEKPRKANILLLLPTFEIHVGRAPTSGRVRNALWP